MIVGLVSPVPAGRAEQGNDAVVCDNLPGAEPGRKPRLPPGGWNSSVVTFEDAIGRLAPTGRLSSLLRPPALPLPGTFRPCGQRGLVDQKVLALFALLHGLLHPHRHATAAGPGL